MDQFQPDDRVHVQYTNKIKAVDYVGTIVHYWRNGYYIVREDQFGTTVAEPADGMTKVETS